METGVEVVSGETENVTKAEVEGEEGEASRAWATGVRRTFHWLEYLLITGGG